MARRSLNAGTLITMSKGEIFKGYYLQSKDAKGQYDSQIHHFIAAEDFDTHATSKDSDELQDIHIKKGQQFGMWGSTILDQQIVNIAGGQYCEVQFTDTKKSTKGKKDMKLFDVFVDDEVPNLDKSRVSAANETLSGDEEEQKGEEEDLSDLPF